VTIKKMAAAKSADANTTRDKMKTDREKVQTKIGKILGEQYYGSEQRLGQFLLNVARSDVKLHLRHDRIVANVDSSDPLADPTFTWFWDITDEEWLAALERYSK
jgi:hypothetical protein